MRKCVVLLAHLLEARLPVLGEGRVVETDPAAPVGGAEIVGEGVHLELLVVVVVLWRNGAQHVARGALHRPAVRQARRAERPQRNVSLRRERVRAAAGVRVRAVHAAGHVGRVLLEVVGGGGARRRRLHHRGGGGRRSASLLQPLQFEADAAAQVASPQRHQVFGVDEFFVVL